MLLDFTNNDKSGLKVLNQLKEFYSSFFDFTDPNLEPLTSEYLEKLVLEEKVSSEEFSKNSDYNSNIHDNSKKRGRNPKIIDLGNLEITDKKPLKKYKSILKITEDYLAKWDYMFQKMQVFYKENEHCTVPRDYKDRTLYGWYSKQKLLFKAGILPKEHLDKLKTINFYLVMLTYCIGKRNGLTVTVNCLRFIKKLEIVMLKDTKTIHIHFFTFLIGLH